MTFALSNTSIDGLGRLVEADETLSKVGGGTITHALDYAYDMRSQLTSASVSNINSATWTASYVYGKDGNISSQTIDSVGTDFDYDGDLMTDKGAEGLDWDENGCMIDGVNSSLTYNFDGRLRTGSSGSDSISVKYDPRGNRVYKESTKGQTTTKRKYIVDAAGGLPVILLEIDPDQSDPNIAPVKTYIYVHGQVLAQHDGTYNDDLYFYLHDRLGSVRQVIDADADVKNRYVYEPYGSSFSAEVEETVDNPFMFAGQYFDEEISQYYLRARQYDPQLYRFTARDPAEGSFTEPLTLHVYLYCLSNPVNMTDPEGLMGGIVVGSDFRAQEAKRSHGALMYARKVVAKVNFRNFGQNLRANLIEYSGFNPGSSIHAHHIFPKQFASQFNAILGQSGLHINNPMFGTWLASGFHLGAVHAAGYNATWLEFLVNTNPQFAIQLIDQAIKMGTQ